MTTGDDADRPRVTTRIILVVAFDGTELCGWQSQAGRGGRTVQEHLEQALQRITGGEPIIVEGAGRTDSGVHALAAVAHADVPRVPERPRRRLNGVLPTDIRVRGVALAPPDFHARRSALGKRYSYRFRCEPVECPLHRRVAWHAGGRLDVESMREAARRFEGERDFASLQAAGSSVVTSTREVTLCEIVGDPPDVRLVVEGTGFLRHMVRAMAGSLVEVGAGRREPSWITAMLEARSREAAGPNAPPHGLMLEEVRYAEPVASLLQRAVAGEDPAA